MSSVHTSAAAASTEATTKTSARSSCVTLSFVPIVTAWFTEATTKPSAPCLFAIPAVATARFAKTVLVRRTTTTESTSAETSWWRVWPTEATFKNKQTWLGSATLGMTAEMYHLLLAFLQVFHNRKMDDWML